MKKELSNSERYHKYRNREDSNRRKLLNTEGEGVIIYCNIAKANKVKRIDKHKCIMIDNLRIEYPYYSSSGSLGCSVNTKIKHLWFLKDYIEAAAGNLPDHAPQEAKDYVENNNAFVREVTGKKVKYTFGSKNQIKFRAVPNEYIRNDTSKSVGLRMASMGEWLETSMRETILTYYSNRKEKLEDNISNSLAVRLVTHAIKDIEDCKANDPQEFNKLDARTISTIYDIALEVNVRKPILTFLKYPKSHSYSLKDIS